MLLTPSMISLELLKKSTKGWPWVWDPVESQKTKDRSGRLITYFFPLLSVIATLIQYFTPLWRTRCRFPCFDADTSPGLLELYNGTKLFLKSHVFS